MIKKPDKGRLRLDDEAIPPERKDSRGLFGKFRDWVGLHTLSADDGAMIFAFETLGDLLAKRFEAYGEDALAAASARIIDPDAGDVVAHLNAQLPEVRIVAALRLLHSALEKVAAEYLKPDETNGSWRLKIDCTVAVEGEKSRASLIRKLDWSSLPDVVRDSYMREEREAYVLTLYPRSAADVNP